MKVDIAAEAAKYYDSSPEFPNDIPLYHALIASPEVSILELGCGTGRVTLALAPHCRYIHGIDISPAMISIGRDKLQQAGIPPTKARIDEGNITEFDLGRRFDLIIAPFRVLQNLDTDLEVDGMFRGIHRHLKPTGTCILNVSQPRFPREELQSRWPTTEESERWAVPVEGGRLVCLIRRRYMDMERAVLYPELVYRMYEGEKLVEESVLKIVMRCHYPDTFEKLITEHGFAILKQWGGYEGEVYGQGPELVIQFTEGSSAAGQVPQ